ALRRCLDALRDGDARPAELVVVDQGRDGSARPVVEPLQAAGWRVVYLAQEPRGLAAAQNAGVAAAASPVVAVTDDDCIPDPAWLPVVARTLVDSREVDVLAGRVLPAPPAGDRSVPVSTRASPTRRDFRGRQVPWHVGSGNNFALRREWYLRVGGCDERLGPGAPAQGGVDMDLFYRLLRAGARVRYEPDALVLHERQTPAERRARRPMYGHGMGAACGIWLRGGDAYALPVLARWVGLRLASVARPRDTGRMQALREEAAILAATARGVAWGLRARGG
ncbi:MAG TPA: glycosyltransferase, partial [Longimicrobiaceae bacterium]|nr:glycosyltransferase [Longimicrobiaceae bacterium]